MSYQALSWASEIKTGSPTRKAVLLALSNYAGWANTCWHSQKAIAEGTELSVRSVARAMDDLEAMGLIKRKRQHRKDGTRTTDLIEVMVSGAASDEKTPNARESDRKNKPKGHCDETYMTLGPSLHATESEQNRNRTVTEPHTEACAKGEADGLEETKRQLRNATGWQGDDVLDYSPALKWLDDGANLETVVLPYLRQTVGKARTRSFKFFDAGIRKLMAAPMAEVAGESEFSEKIWETYVKRYRGYAEKNPETIPNWVWTHQMGPPPPEMGCKAPQSVLARFGYRSTADPPEAQKP